MIFHIYVSLPQCELTLLGFWGSTSLMMKDWDEMAAPLVMSPWRNQRCGSLRQWLALVAFGEELASLRLWDRIEHQVTPTDPSPAVFIWYLMRFAYLLNLDLFPKIQNLRNRAKHVRKTTTAPEICPHHPTSFLVIPGFLAAPWRSLTCRGLTNGGWPVKKSQPPGFDGVKLMQLLWVLQLGVLGTTGSLIITLIIPNM